MPTRTGRDLQSAQRDNPAISGPLLHRGHTATQQRYPREHSEGLNVWMWAPCHARVRRPNVCGPCQRRRWQLLL